MSIFAFEVTFALIQVYNTDRRVHFPRIHSFQVFKGTNKMNLHFHIVNTTI